MNNIFAQFRKRFDNTILSVPVRIKVIGIGLLPILILGLSLNYWITTGLSDWLSYILTDVRVQAAMSAGARSVMLVTILGAVMSIFLSLIPFHDIQGRSQIFCIYSLQLTPCICRRACSDERLCKQKLGMY